MRSLVHGMSLHASRLARKVRYMAVVAPMWFTVGLELLEEIVE